MLDHLVTGLRNSVVESAINAGITGQLFGRVVHGQLRVCHDICFLHCVNASCIEYDSVSSINNQLVSSQAALLL